jgi:2',3'-cyclic-nucleotide 2'-phosphodiesterase (5'-nucleotidase family)
MSLKSFILTGVVSGCFLLMGCKSGYKLQSFEGGRFPIDARYDVNQDKEALAIFAPYKKTVDSIMTPVISHSARVLTSHRPESELSNLVADILRFAAEEHIGRVADVGVMNMGGLRTSLPKGDVTFGSIYEITPFENSLCICNMTGKQLRSLFEDIARVRGEGLSGAKLVISKDGKLLSATVGGKPIVDSQIYKVSTIDYVAEGNDHMDTFRQLTDADKLLPKDSTIRQLFLNYVIRLEKEGKLVDSKVEGRITVKE